MRKSLILSFSLLALTFLLAGCGTLEGAGKDIEKAGQGIQDVFN